MKPGTPSGTQLEPAVNATLPASTSSLPFFMCSFTHGFRFGLLRSAIRKVGCLPTPLGTKGYLASWVRGPGERSGTGSKKGPLPLRPTHPTLLDEKSGGIAFCCATACTIGAAAMTPTNTPPASSVCLKVNEDIVASPTPVLERRDRICRRTGAAANWQRRGGQQEIPAIARRRCVP